MCSGFSDITAMMEHQMDKTMEHEIETGIAWYRGSSPLWKLLRDPEGKLFSS